MNWKVEHYEHYVLRTRLVPGIMHFEIFRIDFHDQLLGPRVARRRELHDDELSWTNDLNEAQQLLSGGVRWDGTSYYSFAHRGEAIQVHRRQELVDLGVLLARVYDAALEYMPHRGEYLAPQATRDTEPAPPDYESECHQAFVEACARHCRCCPDCYGASIPCDGVLAGGLCDQACSCDREEDADREEDEYGHAF